jgi:hypothetical protein
MAIDNLQVLEIIEVMEAFLERKRPPEDIRQRLDIGYTIEGQSIIIHEILSSGNDASKVIYPEVAKATLVKAKNHWKVFWRLNDLKWHAYEPTPAVATLQDFVKLVEEDKYACFWG